MPDLKRIRCRYGLSGDFFLVIPSGEAYRHQFGFLTLYEDALLVGLRLPLHTFTQDVLIHLDIALGQLAPNGWRFLVGAIHLWLQMFGYELTSPGVPLHI